MKPLQLLVSASLAAAALSPLAARADYSNCTKQVRA